MAATRLPLEETFALLEARPVKYSREEIARRLHGAALGKELNRLQGYQAGPVEDRIQALYARGQIDKAELTALTLACSRQGLLERGESLEHDR